MFSRKTLRIKAMQHLFAFYSQQQAYGSQPASAIAKARSRGLQQLKNSLVKEREKIKNIQLQLLQLLVAWGRIDEEQAEAFNRPFIAQNSLLKALGRHVAFKRLCKKYPMIWSDELLEDWYYQCFKKSPSFLAYIKTAGRTRVQDVALIETLIKKIFFKHKAIQLYVSEQDILWAENRLIVERLLLQFVKNFEQNPDRSFSLYAVDAAIEQDDFYLKLVDKTIEQDATNQACIIQKVKNWRLERINLLDLVIIKMGLTEIRHFTDIPCRVSISEYINIAKKYSTEKSYQFINGVLDAAIGDQKLEKTHETTFFLLPAKPG